MEVRRDPRQFLFIIILLILINSPEPQSPGFNTRSRYDEVIDREWTQLEVLNKTRYGDFGAHNGAWLNITGLREEDGFMWDVLGDVKSRARERMRGVFGERTQGWLDNTHKDGGKEAVYRNISGFVHGEWVRSPLSRVRHPVDMNISSMVPEFAPLAEFDRNLTGTHGTARLHLKEMEGKQQTDGNRTISEVKATVVIEDGDSWGKNWWEFNVNGVHFPDFGGVVLTTTSERFGGVFALPHFQLSSHLYSTAQGLLNRTIHETIQRQLDRVPYPVWNPWSSAAEGTPEGTIGANHCEFILFLQEAPIQFDAKRKHLLLTKQPSSDWLEHELRYPTGASLPLHSAMAMSMVGFSPDCGFVIESKGPPDYPPSEATHLLGSKTEEFNYQARHTILIFALTLSLQVYFMIKQAKEAATPSTLSRISFYTFAIMALGDGFWFLALLFMHLFIETSQLALYSLSFLSFFLVIVELRFLMDAWKVQVTEQNRQDRQEAANRAPTNPQPTPPPPPPPADQSEGLPLPVTAARAQPATPAIVTSDQDATNGGGGNATQGTTARVELSALYSRFCFLLMIICFVTLHFTTMRFTARAIYFNVLCFLYLSFWIPQIYRNIMRNCRKALRWDFVVGQSIVRLVPIAYFYMVEGNILFARIDLTSLAVLAGWVWIQIVVLFSQSILGPRFFIRDGWAPPAYDYHPILREDEEGGSMPIGSDMVSSPSSPTQPQAGESRSKGKRVYDCSICAQDIEVPVIPADGGGPDVQGLGGLTLQRRAYMITPCRHVFHTPCLEGWMRYRLQCPNCRETLPPL